MESHRLLKMEEKCRRVGWREVRKRQEILEARGFILLLLALKTGGRGYKPRKVDNFLKQ